MFESNDEVKFTSVAHCPQQQNNKHSVFMHGGTDHIQSHKTKFNKSTEIEFMKI